MRRGKQKPENVGDVEPSKEDSRTEWTPQDNLKFVHGRQPSNKSRDLQENLSEEKSQQLARKLTVRKNPPMTLEPPPESARQRQLKWGPSTTERSPQFFFKMIRCLEYT